MKTFQILLNNEVIGVETVISMSAKAVKMLCERLGYPVGITVRAITK